MLVYTHQLHFCSFIFHLRQSRIGSSRFAYFPKDLFQKITKQKIERYGKVRYNTSKTFPISEGGMSYMNIISPKYDFSAKELFSIEMIRKYFISDVLDIPVEQIHSVRLSNTFLWKRYRRQKQGILDVLVELNDDTKINIELQVVPYAHWVKRILFYLSKMFTEDLKVGDNYSRLKRCVSISILDFNLKESEKYHTLYRLRDDEGNEFSDIFEVHIIELRKKLNGNTKVDDWIRLFNAKTEEELDMIQTNNPGLLEAIHEVKTMSLSKRMRLRYEAHLKEIRDRNAREDYVREEGRQEGEGSMARLTEILLNESRYDDLKRASTDKKYRQRLFEEYRIK